MIPHFDATARAVLSWSGGKDGCLAWLRCREQGLAVHTFLTMCDAQGESLSHALPRPWLAQQVAAFGVAWACEEVPRRPGAYAEVFDSALRRLRAQGHTHMVFGDIDLAAHRDWLVPRCEAAGLLPVFPLWGESRAALAQEIVRRGIQARLVAVDLARLDVSFCGAAYDHALLQRLPEGVCPCGEDGEFHTAVTWAPGLAAPLPLHDDGVRLLPSQPPLRPTQLAQLIVRS